MLRDLVRASQQGSFLKFKSVAGCAPGGQLRATQGDVAEQRLPHARWSPDKLIADLLAVRDRVKQGLGLAETLVRATRASPEFEAITEAMCPEF